jgi:hypothetical protein
MTVEKVSLSLDADLVARARRVAGHRGLSALVNDAIRIKLQHERLRALLAEMETELGPIPAKELARARAVWPERGIARRKSRRSA